jgi:hypothetical protein
VRATGAAPVVTRPRTKAEHLVREAQAAARLVGTPCAFSVASKPYPEKTDTPRIVIPIILTLVPLLSAAAVAIADGAGGL